MPVTIPDLDRLWYIAFTSGNCTIVEADDIDEARARAGRTGIIGDQAYRPRPATQDDLDAFLGMGGRIR
jgi:hypothetical protein